MFQATAGNGDIFYVTGIVDNNESIFNTLTVVGQSDNVDHSNGGAYNKTVVNETGISAGAEDFDLTSVVTTGDYRDPGTVSGLTGELQKVAINQSIFDNTNPAAFNTGFDYTNGTTSSGKTYETFDVNLNVLDGAASAGDYLSNTFQLLETKVDGATYSAGGEGLAIGKTLMIDQTLDDQANASDTFTQRFIQNEAADGAVADNGTVTAGPSGSSQTFTFSAGDTLAVKTLSQTLNGAAADFGLSDAADESGTTNQETGVDNFLGATGMSATFDTVTNPSDPFVTF
jgi:hypothetical protein